MKRIFLWSLLLMTFFSCTKTDLKTTEVKQQKIIDVGVISSTQEGNVTRTVYKNGVVAKTEQSTSDPSVILVTYLYGSKELHAILKSRDLGNGKFLHQILSPEGKEYYEMQLTKNNVVSDFKLVSPMPQFEYNPRLQYPIGFSKCMQDLWVDGIGGDWEMIISCSVLFYACVLGTGIACIIVSK